MSYWIQIGREKIDLSECSTQNITLENRPGGWLLLTLKKNGSEKKYKVRSVKEKQKLFMLFQGQSYCAVIGEKSFHSASESELETNLKAQFPGKVRKILVKEGTAVLEGEKLILLEAMKMEFAVQAPFATRVNKISVTENEQVSPGALLIELAPPLDEDKK